MSDNRDPTLRGHAVAYNKAIPYPFELEGTTHVSFAPGSLAQSIARGRVVAMFNHVADTEFACMVNGTLQLDDDSEFWLSFRILYDEWYGDRSAEFMMAVARGVVRRASIGFHRREYERRGHVLHIKRADLVEISICPNAACDEAYVTMVPMDLSKPWPVPRKPTPKAELKYQTPFPRYGIALGG